MNLFFSNKGEISGAMAFASVTVMPASSLIAESEAINTISLLMMLSTLVPLKSSFAWLPFLR
ncbi:Uncharacterised protein [Proteus mirabilis]|uniref:Uncharacterized protein n=1 Tax=Proteus mirabilis TaxID=584 RepID=A0A2X2BG35_PROMI|nr:Uncharacterised protein [Proteus mirabilis]